MQVKLTPFTIDLFQFQLFFINTSMIKYFFSASMGAMAVGAAIGYSSPASASFHCDNDNNNDNNTLTTTTPMPSNNCSEWWYLSETDRGWFAGSLSIGALVGCLVAGMLINRLGRKGTMLVSVIPLLLGWVLIGRDGCCM